MGQQQLILLVLATVIVGLAIVVGIAAFTQGGDRANADAMIQDAVTIANDAQAWVQKPKPFGGPENGFSDFNNVTFSDLGYAADTPNNQTGVFENANGMYQIQPSNDGITITGKSFRDATTDPDFDGDGTNEVIVAVCGTSDGDIEGAIMRLGNEVVTADAGAPACADA